MKINAKARINASANYSILAAQSIDRMAKYLENTAVDYSNTEYSKGLFCWINSCPIALRK